MSVPPLELEAIRARWRRARSAVGLLDPTREGFGSGGLGRHVPGLRFRVLALPPDPETTVIADLDEDFWEWWKGLDPSGLGAPSLGQLLETTPTVDAAVRYRSHGAEPRRWDLYLALHRHGGVDLCLGREATYSYGDQWSREPREAFRLIAVVGRLWSALVVQSAVLTRFHVPGPWSIVTGLIDTQGTALGHVAEGWIDPDRSFPDDVVTCPEPNVLIVRELGTWPRDAQSLRTLAFELGGAVEDAWGSRQRRFLAQSGPNQGDFDISRFSP